MTEEQEERVIEQPETEYEVVEVPEAEAQPVEEENEVEDLSDLTSVSKEDVLGKRDGNSEPEDFAEETGLSEEDMEDLFGVDDDLFGVGETEEPKPKTRLVRRLKRTSKQYPPPPTSIRGIRQ